MSTEKKVNVGRIIGDSKYNRYFVGIFTVLTLIYLFDGYDQSIYGVTLPTMMKETGIGSEVFGLIGSAGMWGMMIGAIFFGMLADKIGRVKSLIACTFVYAFFGGMIGFAQTATEIAIYRTLSGAGLAGVGPVAISLVTEYSSLKHRNTFSSLFPNAVPLGSVLAPIFGLLFLSSIGWRGLYFISFIPLLLIPLAKWYIPESMQYYVEKGDKEKIRRILKRANPEFVASEEDIYETDIKSIKGSSFVSMFKDGYARNTILFWIQFALIMFVTYGIVTWLPKLMVSMGYSMQNALSLMAIYTIATIPGTYIAGKISRKYGFRKVIMASALLFTIFAFIMSYNVGVVSFIVALIVAGGAQGAVFGLTYAYITLSYPIAIRGTGIGWGSAIGRFGGAFGPLMGGILLAKNVPATTNFLIYSLVFLAVAIVVSFTKENTNPKLTIGQNNLKTQA